VQGVIERLRLQAKARATLTSEHLETTARTLSMAVENCGAHPMRCSDRGMHAASSCSRAYSAALSPPTPDPACRLCSDSAL